jgi:hypothetical protein
MTQISGSMGMPRLITADQPNAPSLDEAYQAAQGWSGWGGFGATGIATWQALTWLSGSVAGLQAQLLVLSSTLGAVSSSLASFPGIGHP